MFERDYDAFADMIDGVYALKGKTLPATGKAIFFRAMAKYPLEAVRAAIDAHVCDPERGQYLPQPADLIARIHGRAGTDGRLGADEAWARALLGLGESETVVTTPEIMEAFSVARAVLDGGDEVGARMAFKDAYHRIVTEARAAGKPVVWQASLGWDPTKREGALREAVSAGLLPAPKAAAMLPPPAPKKTEIDHEGRAKLKEALALLRSSSEKAQEAREAATAAERKKTDDAKRAAAEKVQGYEGQSQKLPRADSF